MLDFLYREMKDKDEDEDEEDGENEEEKGKCKLYGQPWSYFCMMVIFHTPANFVLVLTKFLFFLLWRFVTAESTHRIIPLRCIVTDF
jgi:hypothetical protein